MQPVSATTDKTRTVRALIPKGVSYLGIFLIVFCDLLIIVSMKHGLIAVLLMLGFSSLRGQVATRLYYTKSWLLTVRDSAVNFRVGVLDTAKQEFIGEVRDSTKYGQILMAGTYLDGERSGPFVSYFSTGAREYEGEYDKGERKGIWKYYHHNGELKYEVHFDPDQERILEARDSLGTAFIKNGTGAWVEQYPEPGTGILMTIRGKLVNYQKVGSWTHSLPDGTVWAEEIFGRGEFAKGYVTVDGEQIELVAPFTELVPDDAKHERIENFCFTKGTTASDYAYIKKLAWENAESSSENLHRVEITARPINGMQSFYQAVASKIKYPKQARRRGVEGQVFVEFIVEKDGSLSGVKAIKGIGAGCDEEAARVVNDSQKTIKWIPGIQSRKRARQRFTLPVIFKLG